ncbi:signal transducer and activator of transcription 1-alpha/beta-like [Liolophura sinensis]|uniref:signal transducer and activator of transcription 1-alpha/beta-like n=1 Tax=Liolophura sinensis TaxID=3198878 RepID=UPI0031584F2D
MAVNFYVLPREVTLALSIVFQMELSQIEELYRAGGEWSIQLNRIHSELSPWVRWHCDSWMKDQRLREVLGNAQAEAQTDSDVERYAEQLYDKLLKMCDEKLNEEPDPKEREQVRKNIFQNIQERFKTTPLKLIEEAVNCLEQEGLLWQNYQSHQIYDRHMQDESSSDSSIALESVLDTKMDTKLLQAIQTALSPTPVSDGENLNLKIVHLKSRVDKVGEALNKVKAKEQNYKTDMPFILKTLSQIKQLKAQATTLPDETLLKFQQIENAHTKLTTELKESRESFLKALQETRHKIDEVFTLLLKEISDWKEHQKMFYLKLEDEPITELQNLSRWSTVQTVQPPYIIQVTSTKSSPGTSRSFTAKLRVLALEKVSLAISEEIQVQLLSEAELNHEPSTKKISLELHNGVSYLEKKKSGIYDLVEASFESLQVRKFKRPKRARKAAAVGPDQLFVCEQKFRLVFTGNFLVPGSMDSISLRSVSLPVTITTNSSQESDCSAAQLWQCWNTPADNDTGPYPWPDNASWPRVSEMLNTKMKIDTGRALPTEQLQYLADQLNGGPPNDSCYENLNISWSQFAKEKMEGKDFSFWRWFHANVNLLKFHTKHEWVDGRIYGFVSKSKAKDLLRAHKPGTFLLRISESKISETGPNITGALSPVVVSTKKKNGKTMKGVDQIAPYTVRELGLHGNLGKVLACTDAETKWLYPDMIPLEEAFKDYMSNKELRHDDKNDGYNTYVGRTIHFKLDNLSISDDVDEDCDEEDEIGMEEENEWSGQWSCYTDASAMTPLSEATVVSPSSVDQMHTPFSPEVNSPPVSQQQQLQQHQHASSPNPILTGLLLKEPLQGASNIMELPYSTNSLNGNVLTESDGAFSDVHFSDLPVTAFALDQNADEFPQTSTIMDLDENNIYQIPGSLQPALQNDPPLCTPPIVEDSELLEWSQLTPSFDPRQNLTKV